MLLEYTNPVGGILYFCKQRLCGTLPYPGSTEHTNTVGQEQQEQMHEQI